MPIALIALAVWVAAATDRFTLAGIVLQSWFLNGIFVANLVLVGYRLLAIVDAWRIVDRGGSVDASLDPGGRDRPVAGSRIAPARAASIGGLLAVILVMTGAHVAVAHYDLLAASLADCVFDPTGTANCGPEQSTGPATSATPDISGSTEPTASLPAEGTALPNAAPPTWNGTGRLNILLVGIDQRSGGATYNTDTMIVVSIDPTTNRVAMFSLPRDTVNVPLPPGPLRQAFGTVYGAKINSLAAVVRGRPDLCPGTNATSRGFNCLKGVLGYLYGLDVQYYAEVNFQGFTQIVDALGGVTIAVQSPVVDDRYPADAGGYERIFIPAGIQHMDGAHALIYARSRHGSNDFDRGARQQRVLTSLLAETDIAAILPRIDELVGAFEQTIRTDIPRELLPQLLELASKVDTKAIRSFVFAPPLYETEDYVPGVHDFLFPHTAEIRAAVRTAFTSDPSFEVEREKVAQEGATVWVLDGSGFPGKADDVAAYLDYLGFGATAPKQKAPKLISVAKIIAYNGAADRLPETIRRLAAIFGVTVVMAVDPAIHVDIVVTVGRQTTNLTAPPLP
ncbi:MAG TPA: LCP family protein [Candidatus Dormibacteraeota bacterium]|nr:LCP family protein [Candidatus Dormibacteraeota bacterium]